MDSKWQHTVNQLFKDEEKLIENIRRMKSIDLESEFKFLEWTINSEWAPNGQMYLNKNTGEEVDYQELKRRHKKETLQK